MGSAQDEWQVPAPIRVLVWWPPIAFILVTIAPQTAPVTIAVLQQKQTPLVISRVESS